MKYSITDTNYILNKIFVKSLAKPKNQGKIRLKTKENETPRFFSLPVDKLSSFYLLK